jgi:hypothetical protein
VLDHVLVAAAQELFELDQPHAAWESWPLLRMLWEPQEPRLFVRLMCQTGQAGQKSPGPICLLAIGRSWWGRYDTILNQPPHR